jgi:hypothetical protein
MLCPGTSGCHWRQPVVHAPMRAKVLGPVLDARGYPAPATTHLRLQADRDATQPATPPRSVPCATRRQARQRSDRNRAQTV